MPHNYNYTDIRYHFFFSSLSSSFCVVVVLLLLLLFLRHSSVNISFLLYHPFSLLFLLSLCSHSLLVSFSCLYSVSSLPLLLSFSFMASHHPLQEQRFEHIKE